MTSRKIVPCFVLLSLVLAASTFSMVDRPAPAPPTLSASQLKIPNQPMVLSSGSDTVWIQVHTSSASCPGDPLRGHGGEVSGGPGPLETWCFEGGDSCGTNPPWDTRCFAHEDVRAQASPMDVNYWHIDTYRTDQRAYCGNYALWCGSDSLWTDGYPVECGTWASGKYPGYGDLWNCHVQLTLPDTFDVAEGGTLYFDPRYDTECKYDYFYVDYWNGSEWTTLATFNASSNNPGGECGHVSGDGNPDYWGNTDTGQPNSADWQERSDPGLPAFCAVIPAGSLVVTTGPMFRWRFTSDGAWSDADGRGNTDGAAFIDNVWVFGDTEQYTEDFETGVLDPDYWSLPDPGAVRDSWHFAHDPDPPYEGGDGGDVYTCTLDSSYAWRGRPEGGYQQPGRNQWYYRLKSPSVPIQNTGCVIQFDNYSCTLDYTCDYNDTKVRFYDSDYEKWCPWIDMDGFIILYCSYFWNFDRDTDVTVFYGASAESVQFAWEMMDVSSPSDFCYGKHKETENLVDNVSIGFYDAHATMFSARSIDMLQDTFFDNLCGFNSFFGAYNADTVNRYSGPPYDDVPIPRTKQLFVNVSDRDLLQDVRLYGSVDDGATWQWLAMQLDVPNDPQNPARGGDYYGTLCPDDFGLATWDVGTEVWYYVRAEDQLTNLDYWPRKADPSQAGHTGEASDYWTFSILPRYPATYTGPRVLLVDGYNRTNYDWSPCLSELDDMKPLEDIYEEILTDAGYCYDKYDINGAGSNMNIHPIWFHDYDAVVWFTGPYFANYLFDRQAQDSLKAYLDGGGKVVLCGDRIAYDMEVNGSDSLYGEFLEAIMGCDYLGEVEGGFTTPYFYAQAAETVEVFGTPVVVRPALLDSVLIYRECPYLKDMSYVRTIGTPWPGYTAQPLLRLLNPDPGSDPADMAIYTESNGLGQCVYVNVDLCAVVNHELTYCDGDAASPAPDFDAGSYWGSVDLMRVILDDLFGLPSTSGGGEADVDEPKVSHRWALAQSAPNPCITSTEIRYEVARPCVVSLKVYNALGQVVRVLEGGRKEAGVHTARWDGLNASGERVSSGVYFYTFESDGYNATRKLIVAR